MSDESGRFPNRFFSKCLLLFGLQVLASDEVGKYIEIIGFKWIIIVNVADNVDYSRLSDACSDLEFY